MTAPMDERAGNRHVEPPAEAWVPAAPHISWPGNARWWNRLRRPYKVVAVILVFAAMLGGLDGCMTRLNASVPPGEQRGMVLPTWERDGYKTSHTDAALRQIADIGAGWVQIVPTWYQDTNTSSDISQTAGGPDDGSVRRAIFLARKNGLKVLLKPHVDLLDNTDRSTILPRNPDAWFASYTTFIAHYAELAAELEVEEFAVGTELRSVAGDRAPWLKVIETVRGRYPGPIVYAANHYAYTEVAFWDKVDIIGIDGYWPLSGQPTTDVAELKRSLAPLLDELADFSTRTGRRILFTEAGYASQQGTTTEPGSSKLSHKQDQAEQAAAYQAMLETFSGQSWWAGVYWWVWAVLPTEPANPPESLGFSVRGKAAEAVIRERWGN